MSPRSLPLLNRLRRHRGLWVLMVAVLLIKLLSSSVCLADGGERDVFPAKTHVAIAATFDAPAIGQSGDGDCVLGEGAACHCACPHAAALPMSVALSIGTPTEAFLVATADADRPPSVTGSLLRPPIA
jgi:hypothetical protein